VVLRHCPVAVIVTLPDVERLAPTLIGWVVPFAAKMKWSFAVFALNPANNCQRRYCHSWCSVRSSCPCPPRSKIVILLVKRFPQTGPHRPSPVVAVKLQVSACSWLQLHRITYGAKARAAQRDRAARRYSYQLSRAASLIALVEIRLTLFALVAPVTVSALLSTSVKSPPGHREGAPAC